jgi:hypothetical protein
VSQDALTYQEKWRSAGDPRAQYFFIAVWSSLAGEWFATGEAQKGVQAKSGIVGATWWKRPFSGLVEWIQNRASLGRDLYFSAQPFWGMHRNGVAERIGHDSAHVVPCPIAWGEFDHFALEHVPPELYPSYAWITSGGGQGPPHWHGLWMLDRDADLKTRRLLITTIDIGNDGSFKDAQWLRIPGTKNYKYDTAVTVRMKHWWQDGKVLRVDDIVRLADLPQGSSSPAKPSWNGLYTRYSKHIPADIRRELASKTVVKPGLRSQVMHRIVQDLIEAGCAPDEIVTLCMGCIWFQHKKETWIRKDIARTLDNRATKGRAMAMVIDDERRVEPWPVISGDQIEIKPIDWLWFPFFAIGELTFIDGDPGHGKTWLAMALCKSVADGSVWNIHTGKGNALPSNRPYPIHSSKILYLSKEVSENIFGYRFSGLGCRNMGNTKFWPEVFQLDNMKHLEELRATVMAHMPKVVVIDTLFWYVGSNTKPGDAAGGSVVLEPLITLAREFAFSMVVLRHFVKDREGKPAELMGAGSVMYTAAARFNVGCFRHPDGEPDKFVVSGGKINEISARDKRSCVVFRTEEIVGSNIVRDPNNSRRYLAIHEENMVRVVWEGLEDHSYEELVHSEADRKRIERRKELNKSMPIDDATEWLRTYLSGGEVPRSSCIQEGEARGFSRATVDRAAVRLGIKRIWRTWGLPKSQKTGLQ